MSKAYASLLEMPCPFCGEQPHVQRWHGGKPTKHMISCENIDCPVQPSVTGETLGKALAKWNTRQGCVDIAKLILEMYGLGKKAKKLVEGN